MNNPVSHEGTGQLFADGINPATPVEDHEIAACWRLMNDKELAALGDSILKGGVRFPIVLFEGKILDGRNRYRACQMVGVEPRFEVFTGDPLRFAIDANRERRHDNRNQRAMAAAKLANLKRGSNQYKVGPSTEGSAAGGKSITVAEAAKALGVSVSSVERARRVRTSASPETIARIEAGEMTVSKALAITAKPSAVPAKRTVRQDGAMEHSTLIARAMRLLGSIGTGGLRYAALKQVRDYLLTSYPSLAEDEHATVGSTDDDLEIAEKLVGTLRLIPNGKPEYRDAFKELYGFICEACPDLIEKRKPSTTDGKGITP